MDPDAEPDPAFLHVFGDPGARGLRTDRPFRRGDVVCRIPSTALRDRPSRHTVQTGPDTHIEVGILSTLNHACDPNVRLDTDAMVVVAERDIPAGEELTYFYPSTEWEMAEPFVCRCGGPACLGVVRGARHLSTEALGRRFVNRHVTALLNDRVASGVEVT
jgi:hypothetical protein